jgi:hypothetical protein
MSDPPIAPFQRDVVVDKPGIVGARWWQRSLAEAKDTTGRRNALRTMLLVGGGVSAAGLMLAAVGAVAESDTQTAARNALEMQKQFGWSFGAVTESVTFDGESTLPFDRAALATLADDLRPSRAELLPYYVPTLFQSPTALPVAVPAEETGTVVPLKDALRPIYSSSMDAAYRRGKALASLFSGVPAGVCVVVDLPGPEAVAFAAGAASVFDPVFGFDNWPHPRGVVPAHLTLAAAAFFQPLFAKHTSGRGAPPMFVLDRRRLNAYSDESTQFDNRHVAKLPGAAALRAMGVKRVLCVVPSETDALELDDLNDDFVSDKAAGLDVKLVAANAFSPSPSDPGKPGEGPPYYYGGSADTHPWFWRDYPWGGTTPPSARDPGLVAPGKSYVPAPRTSAYSSGLPGGSTQKPKPANFGTVPVIIAAAGGAILGAKLSRSGSWNRSSGGSGS